MKNKTEDFSNIEFKEESISKKRICSSCNHELPEVLDNRICPHCEKRTG